MHPADSDSQRASNLFRRKATKETHLHHFALPRVKFGKLRQCVVQCYQFPGTLLGKNKRLI